MAALVRRTLLLGSLAAAAAWGNDFLGAESCEACHPDAWAAWQTSSHARSRDVLSPQRRRYSPVAQRTDNGWLRSLRTCTAAILLGQRHDAELALPTWWTHRKACRRAMTPRPSLGRSFQEKVKAIDPGRSAEGEQITELEGVGQPSPLPADDRRRRPLLPPPPRLAVSRDLVALPPSNVGKVVIASQKEAGGVGTPGRLARSRCDARAPGRPSGSDLPATARRVSQGRRLDMIGSTSRAARVVVSIIDAVSVRPDDPNALGSPCHESLAAPPAGSRIVSPLKTLERAAVVGFSAIGLERRPVSGRAWVCARREGAGGRKGPGSARSKLLR
jgi:hypothetical protein